MKKKIPVEIDKLYDVKVEGLSHDGLGIAKIDGFTLFVKNGLPQERVIIKVIAAKKNYAHATAVDWIIKSADRVIPPCPLFEVCGGCQIQHLSYDAQLEFKQQIVKRNMEKFGKINNANVLPTIGMENPWRYRNKTQIPFGQDVLGNIVAGFYKNRSHEIVDMPECFVQTTNSDKILHQIRELLKTYNIEPYNEKNGSGVLRHVVIRVGFNSDEIMVTFVVNTDSLPHAELICENLKTQFPSIKSIVKNVNKKNTNVIFGDKTETLNGEDYIVDYLDGLKFMISARSFYQVNPVQTEILYNKAVEFASISPDDIVFDAYCGIGTITLFLARNAKQVYGVEIVPEAIKDAKINAEVNAMTNVIFEVGKSEEVIPRLIDEGIRPNVIVVDPPRKGCDPVLLDSIIKARPARLVYVSCDSATLARDVAILVEGGYALDVVQPVDMFPQTSHVECVALMSRKK